MAEQNQQLTVKQFLSADAVKQKFADAMGVALAEGKAYVQQVVQIVAMNDKLSQCKPETVYGAALTAASLKLELNPTFGQAYLIPYRDTCTFQIGYKGLKQLAVRSGAIKKNDLRCCL